MKNSKSFRSARSPAGSADRSRPGFRSSTPGGKPRRNDEEATRRPGDARPRYDKAKPAFKGKPRRDEDGAKPSYRPRQDEGAPKASYKPRRDGDAPKTSYKPRRDEGGSNSRFKPRRSEEAIGFRPRRNDADATSARRDDTRSDDTRRAAPTKPRYTGKATPHRYDEGRKPAFAGTAKPAFRNKGKAERTGPRPLTREAFQPAPNTILIWGLHAARAAWLNPSRRITRVWLSESGQKLFEATQTQAKEELLKRPDAKKVERDELDRITPPASVHQGIVIETAPLPELTMHDIIGANPPPDLILMLDQVTDPHNVGAILRSAAAFGAGALIMTERNAPNTTGVLAKSASGALEHTPMVHVVNLARALDDLREAGYWCVGLAEEGEKNLGQLDMSGRTVLVLGNEGDGLRHLTRTKCDELARLPTGGPVGSLNVSNAAAVALYEVRRQAK